MKEINYNARTLMYGKYPKIQKLGACSPYGEMTPFVFNGRLMRMELVDISHGTETGNNDIHAIIRDVETGEVISRFAYGCYYHATYTEGDTVYVTAVKSLCQKPQNGETLKLFGDTIMIFESKDLVNWTSRELFQKEGWRFFNTSLAKGNDGYVLCVESNYSPEDDVGIPFTCYFVKSPDMKTWEFMSYDTAYPKHRYCGGPCMKYYNGYFYLFLVTELPCQRYTNYLFRTKHFEEWEVAYYNPVLMPSEEDKMLSPRAVEREKYESFLENGFNINNSDIDFCEWQGKTYINYVLGNQLGFYCMCEAEYDGTVGEFLEGYFR